MLQFASATPRNDGRECVIASPFPLSLRGILNEVRDDEAISRVFTNLTPFIPLPFKGEGKRFIERGETPLLSTLPFPCQGKGVRGIGC